MKERCQVDLVSLGYITTQLNYLRVVVLPKLYSIQIGCHVVLFSLWGVLSGDSRSVAQAHVFASNDVSLAACLYTNRNYQKVCKSDGLTDVRSHLHHRM
jgi:hypothetical protein